MICRNTPWLKLIILRNCILTSEVMFYLDPVRSPQCVSSLAGSCSYFVRKEKNIPDVLSGHATRGDNGHSNWRKKQKGEEEMEVTKGFCIIGQFGLYVEDALKGSVV